MTEQDMTQIKLGNYVQLTNGGDWFLVSASDRNGAYVLLAKGNDYHIKDQLQRVPRWMITSVVKTKPKQQYKIEKRRSTRSKWYWVLMSAGNHKDLATSEEYNQKISCEKTAHKLAAALNCPIITNPRYYKRNYGK